MWYCSLLRSFSLAPECSFHRSLLPSPPPPRNALFPQVRHFPRSERSLCLLLLLPDNTAAAAADDTESVGVGAAAAAAAAAAGAAECEDALALTQSLCHASGTPRTATWFHQRLCRVVSCCVVCVMLCYVVLCRVRGVRRSKEGKEVKKEGKGGSLSHLPSSPRRDTSCETRAGTLDKPPRALARKGTRVYQRCRSRKCCPGRSKGRTGKGGGRREEGGMRGYR